MVERRRYNVAMNEESTPSSAPAERLQRIVIALRQLERKCRTLSDRHPDFPTVADRLGDLAHAIESRPDSVDFGAAARATEPAVTLFETAGFMTVAREAGRLRSLLADEAPEEIEAVQVGSRRVFSASTARREDGAEGPVTVDLDALDDTDPGTPWGLVLAGTLLIVVVVGVTGWFVQQNVRETEAQRASRLAQASWTPTPVPTRPPPRPTPTRVPLDADGVQRATEFAESLSAARLALVAGDHPAAIENLWRAAQIDRDHAATMSLAERVVGALLARSEHEVSLGQWLEAEATLTTARDIAIRFDRDVAAIDAAARRHAAMPRFVLVDPSDTEGIRKWAGYRAEITLASGKDASGTIKEVREDLLLLDQSSRLEQGQGSILYVEQVERRSIRRIKVWMK
jgi:hypothetical protein